MVLKNSVADPSAVAREHGRSYGFQAGQIYKHAIKGYAAQLSPASLAALRARPDVLSVEEDRQVARAQTQPPQVISNGVRRVGGDVSSTRSGDGKGAVDVNVAVIDDGIDETHPDLNVAGETSCINRNRPNPFPEPSEWHGTMVGGFIGAIDNEIGRVGVAPGARLWGIRALDDSGFGSNSEIICGLDWVVATRTDADPGNDIAVVNMSLGGPAGTDTGRCPAARSDALHAAVCTALGAGVAIVASAGNESVDLQEAAPATYDEVLTATAMADFDGVPGGLQAPTQGCLDSAGPNVDDTAAWFSNFATLAADQAHTVAAPGVCIGSTFPGGQYAVSSGTSFAAPLVTGTVALCIGTRQCAGLSAAQITAKIVADARAYNTSRKGASHGFGGDPLRPVSGKYYGYLIRASVY